MLKDNLKNGSIRTQLITQGAIIAALYVVLSLLTYQFSYLEIQCRVAEALCMTVYFTPAGVWGVFVGCLITNMFSGQWIDIVFGSLATLIAVMLTKPIAAAVRKKCGNKLDIWHSLLIPIPTVVVNAIAIPFVLYYGYGIVSMGSAESRWAVLALMAFSIAVGEIISCYVFGPILVKIMTLAEARIR
ncbi:MAG: QueT transporter family protein [Lachnospiraceae bacterium]|nr:QueT transporter family protein [Lachnospiraceae bacterium]